MDEAETTVEPDPPGYETFQSRSLFGATWAYRHLECKTYGVGYQTQRGARISSKHHVCEAPQFNEYTAQHQPAQRAPVS